ncbi:hypothetical protein UT300003_15540 [Clostridium sardiniense]
MKCIYCGNKCTGISRKVSIDNNTFYTCCDECEKRFDKDYNDVEKNEKLDRVKGILLSVATKDISRTRYTIKNRGIEQT